MYSAVHYIFDLLSVYCRGTGTIIKVGLSAVKKKYTQDDTALHVQQLQDIYWLLEDEDVPNIDVLMQYYINNHVHGSVVYLQPKGMDIFLGQGQEVLEAVVCVLQALKVCRYALQPELL
jgi:hypothetical protein